MSALSQRCSAVGTVVGHFGTSAEMSGPKDGSVRTYMVRTVSASGANCLCAEMSCCRSVQALRHQCRTVYDTSALVHRSVLGAMRPEGAWWRPSVLCGLLPPPSMATQQYSLRRLPHDRQMPDQQETWPIKTSSSTCCIKIRIDFSCIVILY